MEDGLVKACRCARMAAINDSCSAAGAVCVALPPMAAIPGSACRGLVSPFKRYVRAWLAAVRYLATLSGARLGAAQGSALGPLCERVGV